MRRNFRVTSRAIGHLLTDLRGSREAASDEHLSPEDVAGYVLGLQSASDLRRCDAHLGGCEACRLEIERVAVAVEGADPKADALAMELVRGRLGFFGEGSSSPTLVPKPGVSKRIRELIGVAARMVDDLVVCIPLNPVGASRRVSQRDTASVATASGVARFRLLIATDGSARLRVVVPIEELNSATCSATCGSWLGRLALTRGNDGLQGEIEIAPNIVRSLAGREIRFQLLDADGHGAR